MTSQAACAGNEETDSPGAGRRWEDISFPPLLLGVTALKAHLCTSPHPPPPVPHKTECGGLPDQRAQGETYPLSKDTEKFSSILCVGYLLGSRR